MKQDSSSILLVKSLLSAALFFVVSGCGGGSNPPPLPPTIMVNVTPSSQNVLLGATQQFTATVTGTTNTTVNWSATAGTISSNGLYTAPADLPNPAKVTITATSQADSSKSASAAVAVTSDIVLRVSTNPANAPSVPTGNTLQFAASIASSGNPDKSVTWAVNGISGGNGTVGTIDTTGLYTAPAIVPTPFTVTMAATSVADSSKSASTAVIVAGTIASVSQFITAANGGTITLPDGSSATISAGLLITDQTVTLTEYSAPLDQPANGLVLGIGPALYLSFSQPLQLTASIRAGVGHRRTGMGLSTSTALAGISFNINFGQNFPSVSSTQAALASFSNGLGQVFYQGIQGTLDALNKLGQGIVQATCLTALNQVLNTQSATALTIGMYFADLTARPANAPVQGLLLWDPNNDKFVPFNDCSSLQPVNTKVLVVVHGMVSSVEGSFPEMLNGTFLTQAGYGAVFGIDYDWWNGIDINGQYVASQLSMIEHCATGDPIDVMAHSEGVAVSMLALTQPTLDTVPIKHLVAVAGPILGTPVANAGINDFGTSGSALVTVLLAVGSKSLVLPPASIGGLQGLLKQQFVVDLQTGSSKLSSVQGSWQVPPLSNLPVILVGGTDPGVLLGQCIRACFGVFANEPFDGIVGLDSSFAAGMDFTDYRIPAFSLFHTGLVGDAGVLNDIASQLTKLNSSVLPSLTISTSSPSVTCPDTRFCSGLPGSAFGFTGTGFAQDSQLSIYIQDPTGTQDAAIPIAVDASGSVSWTDPTPCSKNPGTYGVWLYDNQHLWASNAVIENLTPANAGSLPLTPQAPAVRGGTTLGFSAGLPPCATSVVWAVNGIPQGNSTIGTIDANGVYTAPIPLPPSNAVDVSVSATIGNAIATGSTTVNLLNPIPVLSSVSPTLIGLGPFALTLNGSNFVPGAVVNFGGAQLTTNFVSSTQVTASGTATTSQVNSSVAVSVTNPFPDSPISNLLGVSVVNTTGGGSGSTAILGNKAYVPITALGIVAVVNVDSTISTGALITSIPMPFGYQPSATAANPITKKVFVVSFNSSDVQLIDAAQDTWVTSYTAPVNQFAIFSGGNCVICGALVDPLRNHLILDTAQGSLLFDPITAQFGPFLPTLAAENFAFNSNSRIALLPTYNQPGFTGLQALNVDTGAVSQYSASVGSAADSAAIDLTTNIAVVPDEFTDNQNLINMQGATFSGSSFSAPQTVFPVPISSISSCAEWTMVSVETGTHMLFLANEFGASSGGSFLACAAVENMPAASVTGAPPLPAVFHWGAVPATPDGFPWQSAFDPHGITVFTSVLNGKAYGFLVNRDQTWVARIDLAGVRDASLLPGGLSGQVDLTPFVTFLRTQ